MSGPLDLPDSPTLAAGELADRHDPRPVRKREVPYRGMVWDVQRDTVDLGAGGVVRREYLEHPGPSSSPPTGRSTARRSCS